MTRKSLFVFLLALILAACATSEAQLGEATVRNGRIVQIDSVSLEGDHQLGLGAVIGAVAGGVLGHQFGGGTGRDIATVLGAVGGGVAVDAVQNRYADRRPGQHIIVKLDNGVAVGVTQPAKPTLRVGDAVRVDGSGPDARVVRR